MHTQLLIFYDNYEGFRIFKEKVDRCLDIISSRADVLAELIKNDDSLKGRGFVFFLKNVIYTLDQAKEVIISFSTDQTSVLDRITGVAKHLISADRFEAAMSSSNRSLVEAMTEFNFYTSLAPTSRNTTLSLTSATTNLRNLLKDPCTSFEDEIHSHIRRMPNSCRMWLNEKIFNWLYDPKGSSILFLQADAGMGKSAYVSSLHYYHSDMFKLWGIFFCKYGITERSDGAQIVLSLTFQIAQACPEFKNQLLENNYALDIVAEMNSMTWNQLLEKLIIIPLSECKATLNENNLTGKALIIIDAVDEIAQTGDRKRELFLSFLAYIAKKVPSFVRLLVTGRPEADIILAFQKLNPEIIYENDPNHVNDLREYIATQVNLRLTDKSEAEEAILLFMERSERKFVYVAMVMDGIKDNEALTLASLHELLPKGIDDVSDIFLIFIF
jgi:hypothetical protein